MFNISLFYFLLIRWSLSNKHLDEIDSVDTLSFWHTLTWKLSSQKKKIFIAKLKRMTICIMINILLEWVQLTACCSGSHICINFAVESNTILFSIVTLPLCIREKRNKEGCILWPKDSLISPLFISSLHRIVGSCKFWMFSSDWENRTYSDKRNDIHIWMLNIYSRIFSRFHLITLRPGNSQKMISTLALSKFSIARSCRSSPLKSSSTKILLFLFVNSVFIQCTFDFFES